MFNVHKQATLLDGPDTLASSNGVYVGVVWIDLLMKVWTTSQM